VFDQHGNLAYGIVATAPSPAGSGTSLTLQTGQGASFPDPANGAYNITIWAAGALPLTSNAEIARVTAKSGDTLTIVRAQEGTSARTVVVGDWVALTITSKLMTDVENGTSGLRYGSQTLTFTGAAPAAQTLVDGSAPTVLVSVGAVTSGAATVKLPAPVAGAVSPPYPGAEFVVVDVDGAAATTNIAVDPNGATIDGSASTKVINENYGSRRFRYRAQSMASIIEGLGPALYWRLNETSGTTAADSSGNGNTGTYSAGVTLGQTGLLYGDAATSAQFTNASTSRVTAASYAPFAVGSKRTFVGVANRSTSTDIDTIFGGVLAASAGAPFLRLVSGAQDVAWFANGNTASVTWSAAWPGNAQIVVWALTYDDSTGTAELFVNGVSKGQRTLSAGNRYNGAASDFFQVGAWGTGAGTSAFNGYQQEVAVFESILTAAQIATIADYYGWIHLTSDVFLGGTQTITGAKTFSSVVTIANGTVGAPALVYSNDSTTGLYSGLAGRLQLSVGGQHRATLANNATDGAVSSLGSSNGPNSGVHVRLGDGTWSAVGTGTLRGLYFPTMIAPPSGWTLSGSILGVDLEPQFSDANLAAAVTGTFTGVQATVTVGNAQTLANFNCVAVIPGFSGTGAITTLNVIRVGGPSVTQAITTYRGQFIVAPTAGAGGSISTLYGLEIADMSGFGATTAWGLAVDGSGSQSYINGKLRVGGASAPTYALDVTGDADVSGVYRVGGSQVAPAVVNTYDYTGAAPAAGANGGSDTSQTWTKPTGATSVLVIVIGAGGAGGGGQSTASTNATAGGGGGGGGSVMSAHFRAADLGATETITVGGGGGGGNAGGAGGNGHESLFGVWLQAGGGGGGDAGAAAATSGGGGGSYGTAAGGNPGTPFASADNARPVMAGSLGGWGQAGVAGCHSDNGGAAGGGGVNTANVGTTGGNSIDAGCGGGSGGGHTASGIAHNGGGGGSHTTIGGGGSGGTASGGAGGDGTAPNVSSTGPYTGTGGGGGASHTTGTGGKGGKGALGSGGGGGGSGATGGAGGDGGNGRVIVISW
jgi:hypothetical protein